MPPDLRPHQRAALRTLSAHGPMPASRLAVLIGHTSREAAEFARRLAVRGYVHVVGGSRGHSPLVSLTRRGARVVAMALPALLAVVPVLASAQETPGQAAPDRRPCGRLGVLAAALASRYGETAVERGLAEGGSLLVVFASADGDTWTAAQVSPDGNACVIATGRGWAAAGKAPSKDGLPS